MRPLVVPLLVLLVARPGAALDITACGAAVPQGEVGIVLGDLDCSGEYAAVTLAQRASLDLNGHAIRGPATKGVVCTAKRCTVMSSLPGAEITGTITGIFKFTPGLLMVSDVSVHDLDAPFPGDHGIEAPDSRVDLARVSTLRTGYRGVIAQRLRATDIESSGHVDVGILVIRTLKSTNLTADGNGGIGVVANRITAQNLVARDNGGAGVQAQTVRIDGGTITGNYAPLDLDVWAKRTPRLTGVTCGRSQRIDAPIGEDFDVSADD